MQKIQLVHNTIETNFYKHLEHAIKHAKRFFFSVAFISDAAVQLLVDAFNTPGVNGKILTTDYMNGTSPEALRKLLKFKNIDLKLYSVLDNKNKRGFHTKGYIFEHDSHYEIIVGSSNLTEKALKSNYEWNVSYVSKDDVMVSALLSEFEYLWNLDESIVVDENYILKYETHRNEELYATRKQKEFLEQMVDFFKDYNNREIYGKILDELEIDTLKSLDVSDDIKPNKMQEIALEGLYRIRLNGGNKGLIIAATGTGKTYLAAFDAFQTRPKRLLFIVHREKILKDAMRSFKHVIKDVSMGLFTGNEKSIDKDYVFASIQTLSKNQNLYMLNEDHFDYIVMDEAHRVAAPTYQKVLNHFKPKFLLGMTATPERTDTNSIFSFFDNQVAAEIRLRDALEENMVVPFHYFGIKDIVNYEYIDVSKEIDEWAEILNIKSRVDLILENIDLYGHCGNKTKALGFCANIAHAKYMANQFNSEGYKSVALTGENTPEEREQAIRMLEDDDHPLSYIFTVDIFNEGIDIPSINLVLLLRPTQSPIIFTQQIGRGLRLHEFKSYLTILDFIGNHNKTFMIPIALSGDISYDKDDLIIDTKTDFLNVPGDTFIKFDEFSKEQILRQLERFNFNSMSNLKDLYFNTKKDLNRVPTLLDFGFDGLDPVRFIEKTGSYINFANKVDPELSECVDLKDENFLKVIRFIDGLLPFKRIYEGLILRKLFEYKEIDRDSLYSKLYDKINNPNTLDFEHAIKHLTLELLGENDKLKYLPLIEVGHNNLKLSYELMKSINTDFKTQIVINSLEYGIQRYIHEFGRLQPNYPSFALFQKYKTKELTLIMRNKRLFVIQSGLFKHGHDYYLMITLEKGEVKESINYKDHFIDTKTFQWESPNNTREMGETGQNLIHHKSRGFNIHLFVKKGGRNSEIYSKELVYVGKVDYVSHENEKPIRFIFNLQTPVRKDIYLRLTKEHDINEKN